MVAIKTDPKVKDESPKVRYSVRIQKAIKSSVDLTKPLRQHSHKILERYAAGYYTGDTDPARPVNAILRGIQILIPRLVAQDPKALITADKPNLRPAADTLSRLCNKRMRNMQLHKVIRKAVYNSLWSMGITKTGLCADDEMDLGSERFPTAKMYCDVVDFEDFIFDPTARCLEECEFIGNGYMIPMDELKDSGKFKNYDEVRPISKLWGETTPEDIAKNQQDYKFRQLHDYAYVYDVFLPEKKIIATLPKDGEGTKYMRAVDWDGPDTGPYDLLGYNFFPNSILAIPPVFAWLDQDEQLNKMARKMFRQSAREKTVLAYDSTGEKDAARVAATGDGETVNVESIDRLKEIKFGGASPDIFPVIQWLKAQISEQGGNLEFLGGLGASAKTLGQEQIVGANANTTVDDMIWQIHYFAASIMRKLLDFEWSDPLLQETINKQVGNMSIPVEVNSDTLEGDIRFDYNFDVQPYSMQRMTPDVKYQKLLQLTGQLILPTLQIATQQGAVLNAPELVKRGAQYIDVDTNGLYTMQQPADASADAYQPLGGSEVRTKGKSGQGDDRAGSNGANQQSNLNQQQARAYQEPSPAQNEGGI